MNILHINCNYITTALHQLMIEELEKNEDVNNTVFVPTYNKNLAIIKPNSNVIVAECFKKWDRLIYFYKQHKIFNSVKKFFINNQYQLVHAYTLFTDGNVAYSIHKNTGIPYVVAIRDTDINDFLKLRPYLLKRAIEIMKNAERIYFLSPAYRKMMFGKICKSKYFEEIKKKSVIRTNGIDEFWLNNPPQREAVFSETNKTLKLICVAQIIKRKNIPIIQSAVRLLKEEGWNVRLNVVGKSVDGQLLEEIIKDENTEYYDAVPKEKLIAHYNEADIFVLASRTETFGLVYAEAMSQGLPVIYTRGQGFDGHFKDGYIGYSVDCNSPSEIKDKIKAIIKRYDPIQKNCIESAHVFSWKSICKKYYEDYCCILKFTKHHNENNQTRR